nr:MAG TPA: hypothetical protein [Caudoviricetes sp.]
MISSTAMAYIYTINIISTIKSSFRTRTITINSKPAGYIRQPRS